MIFQSVNPSSKSIQGPPLSVRRSRRIALFGLQGRVIVAFLSLITAALASSGWLFATQSNQQLSDMIGQQARLIAYTVALSSEPTFQEGKRSELNRLGHELLKTRSILFVAFLDAKQQPLSLAKRYDDFAWSDVAPIHPDTEALYVAHPRSSATFGTYVDVYAPVIEKKIQKGKATPAVQKPVGYVVVGVSLDREQAQINWVNWLVAGIGAVMILVSLPVAFLLVYSIFKPIRQLVDATRKIAAGRLDFEVDVNRDDQIGELAESFADMVGKVRFHREQLAAANDKLAEANAKLGISNQMLSQANGELEAKVTERTSQLESANRRLTREIDEKEDFLRAVSHDLNAPLRNIAGMASMLLIKHKEKFNDEIVHRLERIQKNVQVETDLISEMLELSRIKTRRQTMARFDTEALVRELEGMLEEDLRSRQISLIFDTPLPALTAERARIRQVFQNLIDNAIKYMGDGTKKEIHVGAVDEADQTRFYVRDTGIGIAEDEVDKVFHVFRRGHSAAVQKVAGKGVGLSSVKAIVEMYEGQIWVESKLGEGSAFFFTINKKFAGNAAVTVEPAERLAA